MRQRQQQQCHVEQDVTTGHVVSSAGNTADAGSVIQDQGTNVATDAAQRPTDASEISTACPATANNSSSPASVADQSEAEPAALCGAETALCGAEAPKPAVSEDAAVVSASQPGAKRGHMQRDRQTDSCAAPVQRHRPGALVISQARLETEHAAAGLQGKQHAPPSTPGAGQGLLQEQPCTPGLVSSSSACCVLPRSCSSNGGDSSGSGLEAENSIRFRRRIKFEALKARREEARQKAEVLHEHSLWYLVLCVAAKCKYMLHNSAHSGCLFQPKLK